MTDIRPILDWFGLHGLQLMSTQHTIRTTSGLHTHY